MLRGLENKKEEWQAAGPAATKGVSARGPWVAGHKRTGSPFALFLAVWGC